MEIYLVRHTTPRVEKGICYGQSDLDISDSFELESKEILEKINFDSETKVYSSPSKRCTKLAALFNPIFKEDKRILEIFPNLKIICTASTGTSHIDLDIMADNNIKVTSLKTR